MDDLKNALDLTNTKVAFSDKSDRELKSTYRLFKYMNNPSLVGVGSRLTTFGLRAHLPFLRSIIKRTIFKQFVGGVTLMDCQPTVDRLYKNNILTVLDYGVEGKESEEELDKTAHEFLKAVDFAASNETVPLISLKPSAVASNEVLEKVHAGETLSDRDKDAYQAFKNRVNQICERAYELGVGVFIDAEESWIQIPVDDLVNDMMELYNKERVVVYNTFQLYRTDRLEYMKQSYEKAKSGNYFFGSKIVRGAYMERERERAREMGYPDPIQPDKRSTDRDFNLAMRFCIDHLETISLCNASHNIESSRQMAELIIERNLPRDHPHLNFSQLYGMSDYLSYNLAKYGFNVAKLVPFGPVKEVIPYLIRRANENTSVTGDMSRELGFIAEEVARRGL